MARNYDSENLTYQQWLTSTQSALNQASREVRRIREYFVGLARRNEKFLKWYEPEIAKIP